MTFTRSFVRLACAALLCGLPPMLEAQTAPLWLEIPSAHLHLPANESASLPSSSIPSMAVHLGRQPQDVPYSRITTRINTQVANVISTQRATEEGIICFLDLTRNPEFALHAGRNSVEIIYRDRWNQAFYASFILQMPGGKSDTTKRLASSGTPYSGGERYALIIGVSHYKYNGRGVHNLAYADADAAAFHDFMLLPHGGNIAHENLEYLLNEDATLDNVKAALTRLFRKAHPADTVIVYLNTHGAYDPSDPDQKYLLAYDSDPSDMKNTALAIAELPNFASGPNASRHLVVLADTCHERAIGVDGDPRVAPHNLVNLYLTRAFAVSGQGAMEASDAQQLSHDGTQWGSMGVFTHYVMKGLAGEADANADGNVTAEELFRYVQLHVSEDTFDQQLPIVSTSSVGNVVLAGLGAARHSTQTSQVSGGR